MDWGGIIAGGLEGGGRAVEQIAQGHIDQAHKIALAKEQADIEEQMRNRIADAAAGRTRREAQTTRDERVGIIGNATGYAAADKLSAAGRIEDAAAYADLESKGEANVPYGNVRVNRKGESLYDNASDIRAESDERRAAAREVTAQAARDRAANAGGNKKPWTQKDIDDYRTKVDDKLFKIERPDSTNPDKTTSHHVPALSNFYLDGYNTLAQQMHPSEASLRARNAVETLRSEGEEILRADPKLSATEAVHQALAARQAKRDAAEKAKRDAPVPGGRLDDINDPRRLDLPAAKKPAGIVKSVQKAPSWDDVEPGSDEAYVMKKLVGPLDSISDVHPGADLSAGPPMARKLDSIAKSNADPKLRAAAARMLARYRAQLADNEQAFVPPTSAPL